MEIFNIHIFEFLLIAGLALVVFGPERLPEVGRFVGKQVARVLAWQQNSPEAQMLQDIRQEFEQEIVSLRDELVRTRQQITNDVKLLDDDTRSILSGKQPFNVRPASGQVAAAAPNKLVTPAEASEPNNLPAEPAELVGADGQPLHSAPELAEPTTHNGVSMPEEEQPFSLPQEPVALEQAPSHLADTEQHIAPPELEASDRQLLLRQLQILMVDVQALMIELQDRGVIDPTWQPPSQNREETVAR